MLLYTARMNEKKCTRCLITKPYADFNKATRERDGLQDRCRQCNKEQAAAYRAAHPEKERDRHAKYHAENREAINARISQWQKDNRHICREKSKRFYHSNKEKERTRTDKWHASNQEWIKENNRKWRLKNIEYRKWYELQYFEQNKDRVYAKNAKKRALKRNATALWANQDKIRAIYAECIRLSKETGVVHHVDHVIPLASKVVCGLHCEQNLQILTATENLTKLNRFTPYSV